MTAEPNFICPCCGQIMATGSPLEDVQNGQLTMTQRRIAEALAKAYPRPVRIKALVDHCYAEDPQGGPDDASNVIRVSISRLRKKLPKYGWTIPKTVGGPGNYGTYRLEKLTKGEDQ